MSPLFFFSGCSTCNPVLLQLNSRTREHTSVSSYSGHHHCGEASEGLPNSPSLSPLTLPFSLLCGSCLLGLTALVEVSVAKHSVPSPPPPPSLLSVASIMSNGSLLSFTGPNVHDAEDGCNTVLYEQPRALGAGVDYFNIWGEPISPLVPLHADPVMPPPLSLSNYESPWSACKVMSQPSSHKRSINCAETMSLDQFDLNSVVEESEEITPRVEIDVNDCNDQAGIMNLKHATCSSVPSFRIYEERSADATPLPSSSQSDQTSQKDCGETPSFAPLLDEEEGRVGLRPLSKHRRALVLGANSFTGLYIVQHLLDQGYDVRVLAVEFTRVADLARLQEIQKTQSRSRRLTLVNASDLYHAVPGCHYIIHHLIPHRARSQAKLVRRYADQARDVFYAAKQSCDTLRRVILVSSAATFFPVETATSARARLCYNGLARATQEAERLSAITGVPLTVLLPSAVVGGPICGLSDPNVEVLTHYAMRSRCGCTHKSYFNVVDVRDVAAACATCLDNETGRGQRYVLTGGELSVPEVGRLLHEHFPFLSPPTWALPVSLSKSYARLRWRLGEAFCRPAEVAHWHLVLHTVGANHPLDSRKWSEEQPLPLRDASVALVEAMEQVLQRSSVKRVPTSMNTSMTSSYTLQERTDSTLSDAEAGGSAHTAHSWHTPMLVAGLGAASAAAAGVLFCLRK